MARKLENDAILTARARLTAKLPSIFPGRNGLDKPTVLVFPKLVIGLQCGLTEFTIPESELRLLAQNATTA